MDILDGKSIHTSRVRDFFSERPFFDAQQSLLLNIRSSHRWFDLLKFAADEDLYTFEEALQGKSGPEVTINGNRFYMMSSYDYLGFIGHPEIEKAAIEAIHEYGTGSGGVRLLTGTNELHYKLENKISRFIGTESAMVLSSGYMANIAAISALFNKRDVVITDEYIHHSIRDAIKITGIRQENFQHNNIESLKGVLRKNISCKRKLIIVEGVYSMEGDICPLPEIIALKEESDAFLMLDEAHSFGVMGKTGRGITEHFNIDAQRIDIITGSLSKSIPSNGGFIAAKEELILYLKHGSGPFMFSAALTPSNTAAAIKTIEVISKDSWRINHLWENTRQMITGLNNIGIDTGNSETPVVPVMVGTNEKVLSLAKYLFDNGFIANAVVYPAVPLNRARLRLCCTAGHTSEIISRFVKKIGDFLN